MKIKYNFDETVREGLNFIHVKREFIYDAPEEEGDYEELKQKYYDIALKLAAYKEVAEC